MGERENAGDQSQDLDHLDKGKRAFGKMLKGYPVRRLSLRMLVGF